MPKEPFKRHEVLQFARRMLEEGVVVFTPHAQDRMKERKITSPDVENIILGGYVNAEGEEGDKGWTYAIETYRMGMAVAFRGDDDGEVCELVIVSVWRRS